MKSREPGRVARVLHVAKHRVEGIVPQTLRYIGNVAIMFGLGWLIGWAVFDMMNNFSAAWPGIIFLTLGVAVPATAFLIEDARDQERDVEDGQPKCPWSDDGEHHASCHGPIGELLCGGKP